MKSTRYPAALMLGLLVFIANGRNHADEPTVVAAPADVPAEPRPNDSGDAPQPLVALVDVQYVLQNYPPFATELLQMKADIAEAETALQARKHALEGMQRQLAGLEVGSPAHANLTRQVASAQAQSMADTEVQKQEFVRREAGIYLRAYEAMQTACKAFAKPRGIGLIVRCNEAPINRNNPQDILGFINRPIIWHDGGLDITRAIVEIMKADADPDASRPKGEPAAEPSNPADEARASGLSRRP